MKITKRTLVLFAVLLVLMHELVYPSSAHAKDEGPEAVTNAYFFCLEHDNFGGAFSLYSDRMKKSYGTADEWKSVVMDVFPQMAIHVGRAIESSTVKKDSAIVRVMIVGSERDVWAVILKLKIEKGVWLIDDGVAKRVGIAKPAM